MRISFYQLALIVLLCGRGGAAEPLSLQVMPGATEVYDLDLGDQVVAQASPGIQTPVTLDLDAAKVHHLAFRRQNFDELTVTVSWASALGRWKVDMAGDTHFLEPGERFALSRTVSFNTVPDGADVFQDAPASHAAGTGDSVIVIAGVPHRVVPLLRRDGRYVLPAAMHPQPIILTRRGFSPLQHEFQPGELDTASTAVPAMPLRLTPLYGPFSYGWFNATLATLACLGGLAWALWFRPRALQRSLLAQREQRLAAQVITAAHKPQAAGRIKPTTLLGHTVRTDTGDEFLLLDLLGQGGMGAVYRATEVANGETWAVKVLLEGKLGPDMLKRFEREVRICSHFVHPGIVKVRDSGVVTTDDGHSHPFMVMELIDGETLRSVRDRSPDGLPPELVVAWTIEILKALQVAHRAGVVHRDIKPENLMLTSGQHQHVKIMDFGIARQTGDTMTATRSAMGTPMYMSPEHFNAKNVTPASDIYSVGAVMYLLLAGQAPYSDEEDIWALVGKILMTDPNPLLDVAPDVPPRLAQVVHRMLARRPEDRYISAEDALATLQSL